MTCLVTSERLNLKAIVPYTFIQNCVWVFAVSYMYVTMRKLAPNHVTYMYM